MRINVGEKMHKMIVLLLCLGLCGCVTPIDATKIRQDYVNSHPNLPQRTKDSILEGSLFAGMTRDEVKASHPKCAYALDSPESSSHSRFGSSAIYRCYQTYFHFYNDKLESVNQFNY